MDLSIVTVSCTCLLEIPPVTFLNSMIDLLVFSTILVNPVRVSLVLSATLANLSSTPVHCFAYQARWFVFHHADHGNHELTILKKSYVCNRLLHRMMNTQNYSVLALQLTTIIVPSLEEAAGGSYTLGVVAHLIILLGGVDFTRCGEKVRAFELEANSLNHPEANPPYLCLQFLIYSQLNE